MLCDHLTHVNMHCMECRCGLCIAVNVPDYDTYVVMMCRVCVCEVCVCVCVCVCERCLCNACQ